MYQIEPFFSKEAEQVIKKYASVMNISFVELNRTLVTILRPTISAETISLLLKEEGV